MKRITTMVTLLIATLGLAAAAWGGGESYSGNGTVMVTPDELEWGPVGSMDGDAKIAVIEGDLGKEEPFTFRLKLPPDYELNPHAHPAYERVTVLSGTLHFARGEDFERDGTQALGPGSVAIMAPGEPMFGHTGNEETVIQLHGEGPWGIEYLDPADDPR